MRTGADMEKIKITLDIAEDYKKSGCTTMVPEKRNRDIFIRQF